MKLKIKQGTTSKLLKLFVQDTSVTDGSGLTGVAHGDITGYWIAEGDASPTPLSFSAGTTGTWSDGGWSEVDSTNLPGVYELGITNNAIDATSEGSVLIMIKGATNMAPVVCELELDAVDYRDATDFGLSNLDAAITSRSTLGESGVRTALGYTAGFNLDAQVTVIQGAVTQNNTDIGVVDSVVDSIKTVTDNLPNSGALTDLASASSLSTVDTVVDAIKVKTDQFVFTTPNQVDANALSGGGSGGLDAAGVRNAIGLSSANLDTQLADIPTVAEFEARTLVASAYFDPAADTVSNVSTTGSVTDPVTTSNAADVTAIKAKTDQFVFSVANQVDANAVAGAYLTAAGVRTAVGLASNNLDAQLSAIPTAAAPTASAVADAVWDEAQSAHTTIGSFGYYLDARVSTSGGGGGGGGAAAIWGALLSDYTVAGTFGARLQEGTRYTNTSITFIYIQQGDSYDDLGNAKLQWTVTKDYTVGWSGNITIRHRVTGVQIMQAAITVVDATTIKATLTSTDTAFTGLTTDADFGVHPYEIQLTNASVVDTVVNGVAEISKNQS